MLARTVADPSWRLARRSAVLLAVEPIVLVVVAAVPATRDLVLSVPSVDVVPGDAHLGLGPVFAAHTIEGLRATLAEEAIRDPLTDLYNRRHLDPVLAAALATEGDTADLSVLIVDIDHFKGSTTASATAPGTRCSAGRADPAGRRPCRRHRRPPGW